MNKNNTVYNPHHSDASPGAAIARSPPSGDAAPVLNSEEEIMAPNAKPMSGTKLASIITALGNAYDYGTAAMLNSNPEERAELEAQMLVRLHAAVDHAEFRMLPKDVIWRAA